MRSISALLVALCFLAAPADARPKANPAKTAPASAQAAAAEPAAPPDQSGQSASAPKVDPVEAITQTLNEEWAEIFYHQPSNRQAEKFKALLPRIGEFKARYPHRAEPLILEAITICTLVAAEWHFNALSRIEDARDLLVKSIDIDPRAMEAAAYITLGNLYYRLPGWPISFGDDDQALQYLEAAAKLYPDALDANYFLGDYWLGEDEYDKALVYLEKASQAPVRHRQLLSDTHLKGELEKALKVARKQESGRDDFFSQIMPSFGGE